MLLSKLRNVPVAYNGIAISCITLASFYQLQYLNRLSNLSLITGVVIFLIETTKYLIHFDLLKTELDNYLSGGYLPLFSMFLAILANKLHSYHEAIASILWYSSFILHLSLLMYFATQEIRNKQLSLILPSWFIPPIGFIAIGLSAWTDTQIIISHYIYIFALILIVPISLAIILRQIITPLSSAELYSTGIYAAPLSLLLLALSKYTIVSYQILLITSLFYLNLLFNVFSVIGLVICLRRKFSVGLAAFTFPFAVSGMANLQLTSKFGLFALINEWLSITIATIMTCYIIIREIYFSVQTKKAA